MFTYKEVFEASIDYFDGDEFAAKVFVDKYALSDSSNYFELTPDDMHKRLAKEFARIESKYPNPMSEDEIYNLMKNFKYIVPQGSPMSAIGNDYKIQSAGNCFVIGSPFDSYGGICKTDQELAQLAKRRAGVGFDISNIRPRGMPTKNAAGTTDGIAIFMERFSNTCREVAQGGRRGALMLSISIEHPEIETFITIKEDLKKVTGANISIRVTDEFMNAVKTNSDFTLKFPVECDNPKFTKVVKAKEIWDKMMHSAWKSAEPGILFWDKCIKDTPSDIYKDFGFKSISTNPCISGDTLIAVADGRNAVSIKQLTEEGKDVPVYSYSKEDGNVSIKMGRAPRITGTNKKLLRITFDDGSHLDATENHNFRLLNGQDKKASELIPGDSLPRFIKTKEPVKKGGKDYYQVYSNIFDDKREADHRMIAKFFYKEEYENLYNKEKINGFIKGGLVIHHKDYDSLNNRPENLQVMTFKDHVILHNEKDNSGENNGKYCGFTNDQIKEKAIELTKYLNRRFSKYDWETFATKEKLPKGFSQFRKNAGIEGSYSLAKWAAKECGFSQEEINYDPRLVRTLNKMKAKGYETKIENNEVLVKIVCIQCNEEDYVAHGLAKRRYCSQKCLAMNLSKEEVFKQRREIGHHNFWSKRMEETRFNQAKICSDLMISLKREPLVEEWEDLCKDNKISRRIGKSMKYGFKNFNEVLDAGKNHNHKVTSVIELDGLHDVYNITVDDNHTYGVITKEENGFRGVFIDNCGEIILSKEDSCRLLIVSLPSFVDNPFMSSASFNKDLFFNYTKKAQRLMDDLIDLEEEKINKILDKIKSDPEDEETKRIELNLWSNVKKSLINGRRTGLGITGFGDCLAKLNIKYGSKESIDMAEVIYKIFGTAAHTSSCELAKERAAFPVFNYELEKDHSYLNRIFDNCSEEIRHMWKTTGRRNIALTTIAPTGSVSTLTQTTSGIEPAFLLSYVRRKKINPSDVNSKVDFVDDLGDKWQEFTVYHHGVKEWMEVTGKTNIEESPYFGATSNEIDWVASADIQAAAQKYISHSISKTCVTKDTLIETDKGLMYLDEIFDIDSMKNNESIPNTKGIKVKNADGKFVEPSYFHNMGIQKIIRLELNNGLSIKVTPKEQFLALDDESGAEEWEYIENICPGDRVRLS